MRPRIAAMLLLAGLPASLTTLWAPEAAASGPEITWLRTECRLGAFNETDGPADCLFPFVNTGDEPVVITAVRTSCGCTSANFSRDEVAPGDTAVITATYDPRLRPGPFEKRVVVNANTSPAKHTLTLCGTVIGSPATMQSRYPVEISPALRMRSRIMAVGKAQKGSAKTEFIEMYNCSADTIVPRFENLPEHIRITPGNRTGILPPGQQQGWSLVYLPDATDSYGIVSDTLRLIPGDGFPAATVEVIADIVEDFSALTPGELDRAPVARLRSDRLDFGDIRHGHPVSLKAVLSNAGKTPLKIRRVYTADRGINVSAKPMKVKPGKKAEITVTVDPAMLPADTRLLSARIAIITNDPANPVQTLRAVGLITEP